MKTWLRPKILITTAWIYGGAIFLPTFYFAETAKVSTESQSFWYCGTIPNNTLPGFVYLIFLFIFGFGIQLITIIVLYSRVGKAIWSRERKISRTGTVSRANAETMDKTRKRVTRMLLIVVICFLLCWAPFVVYTGFIERWVAPFPNPADPVRVITYAFGLFNSVCNPFIYFFNSPNFRRDSLRKVCMETITSGGDQDHKHNYSGSSSSSTKNSVVSRTDTKVRSRTSTVKNDPAGKLTKQVNISKVSHDNGQGNFERSENVHFSFDNKTFDTKL